jgi:hypothetical protein
MPCAAMAHSPKYEFKCVENHVQALLAHSINMLYGELFGELWVNVVNILPTLKNCLKCVGNFKLSSGS